MTGLQGIFPSDDLEHLQFAINFFIAIGLGELTDVMSTRYGTLKMIEEEEAKQVADTPPRVEDKN
jgi:pre-mRNA-splicing factor CWC22